jgi:hypothetical protein
MTRRIAALAAAALVAVGGATLATSASAHDSWSVSIGAPGVAFGYSTYGYAPYYYAPAPAYYYGPPVVYRPYYRPYYHRHYYGPYAYYRHW